MWRFAALLLYRVVKYISLAFELFACTEQTNWRCHLQYLWTELLIKWLLKVALACNSYHLPFHINSIQPNLGSSDQPRWAAQQQPDQSGRLLWPLRRQSTEKLLHVSRWEDSHHEPLGLLQGRLWGRWEETKGRWMMSLVWVLAMFSADLWNK